MVMSGDELKAIESLMVSSPLVEPPADGTKFTPQMLSSVAVGDKKPGQAVMVDDAGLRMPLAPSGIATPAQQVATATATPTTPTTAPQAQPVLVTPAMVTSVDDDESIELDDSMSMSDDDICWSQGCASVQVAPPVQQQPPVMVAPAPPPAAQQPAAPIEPQAPVAAATATPPATVLPAKPASAPVRVQAPVIDEGPADELALQQVLDGWVSQTCDALSAMTGVWLLASRDAKPSPEIPAEAVLWRMRWTPDELVEHSPEKLVASEATLAAHLVYVQGLENQWRARARALADETDRVMKVRRNKYAGTTKEAQEAALIKADKEMRKLRNEAIVAQAGATFLNTIGERFTSMLNGLKPLVRLRSAQREVAYTQPQLG